MGDAQPKTWQMQENTSQTTSRVTNSPHAITLSCQSTLLAFVFAYVFQALNQATTGDDRASAAKNLAKASYHLAMIQTTVGEHRDYEHYFYKEVSADPDDRG